MNTQQLSLWVEAENFSDIPIEELLSVRDNPRIAVRIAALIATISGENIDRLSDEAHWEKMLNLKIRCTLEIVRRKYANTRPKLFDLRDMPIAKLTCSIEDPEFGIKNRREYLRGAAMCFRARTGVEITEEEFAQMLKKQSGIDMRKNSFKIFPGLD